MSDVLRPLDQLLATLAQVSSAPSSVPENLPQSQSPETAAATASSSAPADEPPSAAPRLSGARGRGPRLVKPEQKPRVVHTPQQRLLILDTWQRSGLPAGDFAALAGLSKHTLYAWKKRFDELGPAGLMDEQRGVKPGSRIPELTKRSILMLKEQHPEWGCQRISDMLYRGPALPASPAAVARVLHEAGYELEEVATRPHPDKVRHFERARANLLWQTDLFTFVLKRQNRRVYLVAFMDDHSRFIVSYGLHASQSSALVLEVLRCGIASYQTPEEILTDNGSQYVTWRGKSAFTRELEQRGIKQIVAAPRRPQTLGKIERFWGTLWRECVETAIFQDLDDARRRIGLFIDHYNFQRPHQGIEGLVPADRFFGNAAEVLKTLRARVAANALELARNGVPKPPFYVTGQVAGQAFSVHAEGERMVLTREGGARQEIELVAPASAELNSSTVANSTAMNSSVATESSVAAPTMAASESQPPLPQPICPDGSPAGEFGNEEPPLPGESPLDEGLRQLDRLRDERSSADLQADPSADLQEGGDA